VHWFLFWHYGYGQVVQLQNRSINQSKLKDSKVCLIIQWIYRYIFKVTAFQCYCTTNQTFKLSNIFLLSILLIIITLNNNNEQFRVWEKNIIYCSNFFKQIQSEIRITKYCSTNNSSFEKLNNISIKISILREIYVKHIKNKDFKFLYIFFIQK
jgi:hypothetical protein